MSASRAIPRILVSLLATVTLGVGVVAIDRAGGTPLTWYVSAGAGGDCSLRNPCGSIDAAYQKAAAGDSILMAAGNYGDQTVVYRAAADNFATNVVVQPQGGAVTVNSLNIYGPHVTIRGLTLTGFAQITTTTFGGDANYSRFENVDSVGQIYITGADNTAIINSHIHPALNSVPIAVTPYLPQTHVPTNTLIDNNEVGPAWASSDWQAKGIHNESIHVLGASNLTIQNNLIWEGGTSASLQIQADMGTVSGVLVQHNFIAGCGMRPPPSGATCAAFYALGVSNRPGSAATQIEVRNNTVRGGIIDYGWVNNGASAAEISGNVVESAVGCSGAMMHDNLFGVGSFFDCSHNTLGAALYTTPWFGGIQWGTLPGILGIGYGVRPGEGFVVPAALTAPTTATPATTVPPSTAPPATSSQPGSFGSATVGTLRDRAGAGYKYGSYFPLGRSASLVNFKFYAAGGFVPQKFIPVIYSVSPTGLPNALVVTGQEVTVAAGQAAGWVTSTLPSTSLGAGSYLLGLISGPNSSGASVFYATATGGGAWNADAYPAPTSAWGTVNPSNVRWSFLVDYR